MAVLNRRPKGNSALYDLIVRDDEGIHVYYGVTDSGLSEEWLALVEEPVSYTHLDVYKRQLSDSGFCGISSSISFLIMA